MRHIPVTEIVKIPRNGGPLKKDMTFSSMLNPNQYGGGGIMAPLKFFLNISGTTSAKTIKLSDF